MALTLALGVEIVHEAHAMLVSVAHVLALVHVVIEHAAGVAPLRAALVVAWVGRAAATDCEARVAVSGSRASSARTKGCSTRWGAGRESSIPAKRHTEHQQHYDI